MKWLKELKEKFESGVAHQFLLYLNIQDVFLKENKLERLDEILFSSELLNKAGIVVFYNRGTGFRFAEKEMKVRFLKILGCDADELTTNSAKPVSALKLLDDFLHFSWKDHQVIEAFSEDIAKKMEKENRPFIGVVLEYLETLVPGDAASGDCADRDILVILSQWAHDAKIRKNRNAVVLIADSLASIAPSLRRPDSETAIFKIPFPDLEERKEAIALLRKNFSRLEGDVEDGTLSNLTSGLNRSAISEIVRDSHYHKRPLIYSEVFSRKKKILEEQSGGLIEIRRPLWGMDAIGDLGPHKRFIRKVVDAMKRNDFLVVPMGILLIGPPGTGKTVFAEALAHEADIPLIIYKNLREMWHGQSERNQDLVFELTRAQAPVITFQDEIDQAFLARGTYFHGDSGVSSRMSADLYEFMSDTALRGKVVWLAATNRPDLLDPAMLRPGRFDVKIPFLPPDNPEASADIIFALLKKMEILARAALASFKWELSKEEAAEVASEMRCFWEQSSGRLYKEKPKGIAEEVQEIFYTGAEIEVILRKAYVIARDEGQEVLSGRHIQAAVHNYIPTKDIVIYNEMSIMALAETDSEEFLSENQKREALKARKIKKFPN
jgi:SpoVK/Ycf46/Vps4 family AAA+-type ATPase